MSETTGSKTIGHELESFVCMYRRKEAMQDGLKEAIKVPLNVMRIAHGCWEHMITMATHGNSTALSDIQVCEYSLA